VKLTAGTSTRLRVTTDTDGHPAFVIQATVAPQLDVWLPDPMEPTIKSTTHER